MDYLRLQSQHSIWYVCKSSPAAVPAGVPPLQVCCTVNVTYHTLFPLQHATLSQFVESPTAARVCPSAHG